MSVGLWRSVDRNGRNILCINKRKPIGLADCNTQTTSPIGFLYSFLLWVQNRFSGIDSPSGNGAAAIVTFAAGTCTQFCGTVALLANHIDKAGSAA